MEHLESNITSHLEGSYTLHVDAPGGTHFTGGRSGSFEVVRVQNVNNSYNNIHER